MQNNYLIPANTKKSQYIFGLFTKFELIMVIAAAAYLIVALLLFRIPNLVLYLLVAFLPPVFVSFLVVPLANYHNVLQLLINIASFYKNRRLYYWKGWSKDEGFTTTND